MSGLNLHVAGCRGSMAVSGPEHGRFGGNTTCLYAEVEPDHHLVVDAGTGLRHLQHRVTGRTTPQRFSFFLTHYHWDHIQGLPVFAPLYQHANEFDVWAPVLDGRTPSEALGAVICRPWWPVALEEAAATVRIRALEDSIEVGPVRVTHAELRHPDGVVGYRLEGSRTLAIATDHESGDPDADERLVKLSHRADVLVHDCQYTPEQHAGPRLGWGHSDWEGATELARDAGVSRLVLTSHDPDSSDAEVIAIVEAARRLFSNTDAAYEGMDIAF